MRRGLTRSFLQVRRAAAAAAASSAFVGRIVFEGDSLTNGYPDQTPYPNLFLVANPGATIFNVATDGNSVNNMLDQASSEVDPKYVSSAVAVIWGGTNDLWEGRTGAQVHSAISSWCTGRRSTGFKIVVLNCIARTDISNTERLALNSLLASSHAFADAVVDVATPLGDWNTIPSYWQVDHIHITTAAEQVVATAVSNAVRGL